jgi:hypothetical protein
MPLDAAAERNLFEVAASAGPLPRRTEALLAVLGRVILPFDGAGSFPPTGLGWLWPIRTIPATRRWPVRIPPTRP